MTLAGPNRRQIPFEFAPELHPSFDGMMVVYVGKTSKNLADRCAQHLRGGDRTTLNQVLCGLVDCGRASNIDEARMLARSHADFIFCELAGDEQVANRDLLEHLMCGVLAPPFNIKSER